MKKVQDINQMDLFAGTEFAPPPPQQKKPIIIKRVYKEDADNEKDLFLRFAKRFKQSIAFLDCTLRGLLPGDYHGTPLWIKRIGDTWENVLQEDADYWINKGYQLIYGNGIVYIIKIK